MTTLVLDAETDNLPPMVSKVWCVGTLVLESGDERMWRDMDDLKGYLSSLRPTTVVGHNHIGFDLPVFKKILGWDYTVGRQDTWLGFNTEFRDTKQLSQFLNPDREWGHSLEDWGNYLGDHKMNFREALIKAGALDRTTPKGAEFKQYHPIMGDYCAQDVRVCAKVYQHLLLEAEREYD